MADLNDKEIPEACARAMGKKTVLAFGIPHVRQDSWYDRDTSDEKGALKAYNPLTDHAQAMELGESDPVLFAKVVGVWASRGGKDNLLHMICHAFAEKQIEKEKNT